MPHSGGVKIKISGNADPTPSLQEDPPVRGPTNKLARGIYFLLQFAGEAGCAKTGGRGEKLGPDMLADGQQVSRFKTMERSFLYDHQNRTG